MSLLLDAELLVPLLGWVASAPLLQLRQATRLLVAGDSQIRLHTAAEQVLTLALPPSNAAHATASDGASASLSDAARAHLARFVAESSLVLQQLSDFLLTEQVSQIVRSTHKRIASWHGWRIG